MPKPREKMETEMSLWFKHLQESGKTERRETHRPFITISRECGAYGVTIADMLAEYLREHERRREAFWTIFDKDLIQRVTEEHKCLAGFENYFAESPKPFIEDILEELFGLHPSRELLIHSMGETILHLATFGYVILIGRGANIITRKLPKGIHVRLIGSFEKRVAHMKDYLNVSEKQAHAYVLKEDRDRKAYIKQYFQKDINDASLYDLIINTDTVPIQDATIIIGNMVLKR